MGAADPLSPHRPATAGPDRERIALFVPLVSMAAATQMLLPAAFTDLFPWFDTSLGYGIAHTVDRVDPRLVVALPLYPSRRL
jgi:hypothetical protein